MQGIKRLLPTIICKSDKSAKELIKRGSMQMIRLVTALFSSRAVVRDEHRQLGGSSNGSCLAGLELFSPVY